MTKFSVPDMSCGHCVSSIQSALAALPGIGPVTVDLAHKQVNVTAPVATDAVVSALGAIGFPATVMPD